MHLTSSFITRLTSSSPWKKSVSVALCLLVVFAFLLTSYLNNLSPYSMPPDRDLTGVVHEYMRICSSKIVDLNGEQGKRRIYFITPTYFRAQQIPELTRLSHTLMLVPNLHWIVAEDSDDCSPQVAQFLDKSGLPYTHLVSPMPGYFQKFTWKPKGVSGRRAALSWLKLYLSDPQGDDAKHGVLYFGDDDNTFDLRLFSELRKTRSVSMFPVGLIGEFGLSTPVVKNGTIVGFVDSWPDQRKYPVDMAGFAVGTEFFLSRPQASMPYLPGHEEDRFLRSLQIELEDVVPLANNCTDVYVWHTKTLEKDVGSIRHPSRWKTWETNLARLYSVVQFTGMAVVEYD